MVLFMDTFDKTMTGLMKSAPAEIVKTVTTLKSACICPGCPSYTGCAKNSSENLFCAIGSSFNCITQDKGCICPGCPVVKQVGLTRDRYCMKGSEASQRYFQNVK
jgi:hypothetical protein